MTPVTQWDVQMSISNHPPPCSHFDCMLCYTCKCRHACILTSLHKENQEAISHGRRCANYGIDHHVFSRLLRLHGLETHALKQLGTLRRKRFVNKDSGRVGAMR